MKDPLLSLMESPEGRLFYEGLPYKGKPYSLKESDPEWKRPVLVREPHIQQFDLNKAVDIEAYVSLLKSVCNGTSVISFEERRYDRDIKSWHILVRWMDMYFSPPQNLERMSEGEQR